MLYTDGLVERRHVSLDDGINAAADLLAGQDDQHPGILPDKVMSGMMPAAGFEDDVAVLVYRHPPDPLILHMTSAEPTGLAVVRARLREWLPGTGIGVRDSEDILIAVGEAAANAIEHAPAGLIDAQDPVLVTITVRAAHAAVVITVTDNGRWLPPHEETGTRGHGILFMHAFMDDVNISTSEQGTTVTMTKEL
jgi:anti-sigma regulatory factor (Ser/Thr protein kinase)